MNELLANSAGARPFYTFWSGGRLYGLDVRHVREVSPLLPVTRAPQAAPSLRGLVNLRSRIYLALDLRPLLGMPLNEFTADSRFVILKSEVGQDLGLLVERGGDIVHVRNNQIEQSTAPSNAVAASDAAASLIAGVGKLENELMMIVDPTRLPELVARSQRTH